MTFIRQAESCVQEIRLHCKAGRMDKAAIRLTELASLAAKTGSAKDRAAIHEMASELADEITQIVSGVAT